MSLILNNVVLLLTNLFEMYIMHRFMCVFFSKRKAGLKTTIAVYFARFAIGSAIMICGTYPIVNIVFSLVSLFLITLCYEAVISKRIVITIVIYMCMFLAETVVSLCMQNRNFGAFHKIENISAMISIFIEIVLWLITLLLGKFRNIKKNVPLPKTFTIAMIIVFLISLYMEMLIFQQKYVNDSIAAISLICVLSLNFVMIYLYDSLSGMFEERTKAELVQREKVYYHKQSEILQKSYDELKHFRHDMKNHIFAVNEMINNNEINKVRNYISNVTEKIENTEMFSQTGNVAIDGIINYKLSKAYNMGIKVNVDIAVPANIKIDDDDIVIILGNLLDNAIEAVEKIKKDKYISINFKYDRKCAFINVINSFDNVVNFIGDKMVTRKKNGSAHGIGLESVQNIVEKYDGILDLEYENKKFVTSIILYL